MIYFFEFTVSLTISAAQVDAFIQSPTSFSGYSAGSHVIITGAISYQKASLLNTVPATYIQASVTETSIANIAGIAVDNASRTSLNKFSFVVSDTSATAAELNSVIAKTSIAPDFSNTDAIEASSAAAVKALYAATTVGLGSETVSINDTTVNAADLNTINAATDKKITLSATSPTVAGLAADVKTLLVADAANNTQLAGVTAAPITITDSGTVDAAVIEAIVDNAATGLVTVSSSATALSATSTILAAVRGFDTAGTPSLAGTDGLELLVTNDITAAAQAVLAATTTGKITANITTTTNDAAGEGAINLSDLVGTGHKLTITINDAALTAAELIALDAVTTEKITLGSAVATLTGNAADVTTVLTSAGFNAFPSDIAVTVNSGLTTVSQANIIDGKTTGIVTADISAGDMASLNTLTGTGNKYAVTVTDAQVNAADLNALNAKTDIAITVNNVLEITGSVADVKKFYTDADKVDGLGAKTNFINAADSEAVKITDTTVDAGDLAIIRAATGPGTSGAVTLLNVNTLTGTSTEIESAFGFGNVSGIPANVAATVKDANNKVLAAKVKAVDALTTGLITIDSTNTSLSGTLTDVRDVLKQGKLVANATTDTTGVETVTVSGLNGLDVEITGTQTGATAISVVEKVKTDYTVGKITATVNPDVKTAVSFLTAGHDNFISQTGNEINIAAVTAAGGAAFAAADTTNLVKLAGVTSGTLTISPADSALTGTSTELSTIYGSAKFVAASKDTSVVVVTDAAGSLVQASDLKTIDAGTAKLVTVDAGIVISGSGADVNAVLGAVKANEAANNGIFGVGANNVLITDLEVDHAQLDTLFSNDGKGNTNPLTTGSVTVLSNSIKGTLAQVDALVDLSVITTNPWTGLTDINVTMEGGTAAELKTLEGLTSGSITGALDATQGIKLVKDANLTVTDGVVRHNFTFRSLDTETAVTAADLKLVDSKTNGAIKVDRVTSITGTAADIIDVYASTGITHLGTSETLVITDNPTVTQLNQVLALTDGPVSGTITASMADLNGLTETGNSLTISVTGDYTPAELTALKAKTIGPVNVNGTSTITGSLTEIEALIAAGGIANIANMNVTVTGGSITVAKVNSLLGTITGGTITATITETDADTLDGITRAGKYTMTVSQDSAAGVTPVVEPVVATKITAIAALTSELLTVTSSEIKGTAAEVKAALELNTPPTGTAVTATGLSTIKAEITGGAAAHGDVKAVLALTSGVVKATITGTTLNNFIGDGTTGTLGASLIETGNDLTLSVTNNAAMSASQLKTLDESTTGLVTLSQVGGNKAVVGNIADIKALYASSKLTTSPGIAGLTDAKLTINDGVLTATGVTPGTGVISAADLKQLNLDTTGAITIGSNVTELTGLQADIADVFAAEGGNGIVDGTLDARAVQNNGAANQIDPIKVTVTDAITVAQANALLTGTNGVVTATISDGDLTTLLTTTTANAAGVAGSMKGLNEVAVGGAHEAGHILSVTLTDTEITDVQLADLDSRTAGTITINPSTTTLKGDFNAPTNLNNSFASTGIVGLSSINVTSNTGGGSNTVDEVNNISGKTTGVVTATISNTAIADLKGLTDSGNALTITVNSASVNAADINVLNGKTTVALNVASGTITGALSDIKAAYDANVAGTITGLGNEVITITDTGSISASDLNDLNVLTTGVVTATGATSIEGTAVDLIKTYSPSNAAGVVAGLGNENIIITDLGSVSAADIKAIDAATTGTLTATTATFDAMSYLASNADLITAFGSQTTSAITHYIAHGISESRNTDSFDEKSYLASHADLLTAFGSDTTKATAHYVSNGFTENRAVDTFDELGYVASYKDLITALGADATAAVDHYINFGFGENRTATFDASSYLSANADLSAAFGSDLELAKKHYINHGVNENRALA